DTKIDRILVYSNQAIVTRAGELTFQKANERVVVKGLPDGLVDSSVRVRLLGPAEPRLVNMEVVRVYESTFKKEEARLAKEALEGLQREKTALEFKQRELERRSKFLRSLQVGAKPDGKKDDPEPLPLNTATWAVMLDTVSGGLEKISEEQLKLTDDLDQLNARLTVASARSSRLMSYETKRSKTVALEIKGKLNALGRIEVSYRIHGPRWYPRYSIRADIDTGKVELIMNALVSQETGEDWEGVELEFSAAEPSQSADLPKLLAWHIGAPAGQRGIRLAGGSGANSNLTLNASSGTQIGNGQITVDSILTSGSDIQIANIQANSGDITINADVDSALGGQVTVNAPAQLTPQAEAQTLSINSSGGLSLLRHSVKLPAKAGKKTQRLYSKLKQVEKLYERQRKAKRQGDLQTFQIANSAILDNWKNDKDVKAVFSDVLVEAIKNTGQAVRLIQAQKLARGLISPVRSSGGYDYKYAALRRETVPSDGAFSKVSVARRQVSADFFYEIVPELSQYAFLQAQMKNPLRSPLLAAPARIFIGSDFVSQGSINTTSSGEPLKIGLGVDEAVAVKRKFDSKRETQSWRSKYTFRKTVALSITNNKKRAVNIVVMERIPFSVQKELKVEMLHLTERPTEKKKGGLWTWKSELAPAKEKEITFAYNVTHPVDSQVASTPDPRAAQQ
ncbi:MAG: mucoidy inhibitor MuiA family protein, partial [Planctomycetota bacterium]|nr:mucoidy inhibitor MuiA family protein [Planctomycetota bacterium]